MTDKRKEPCDLCGLDVEDDRYHLRTRTEGEKKFCCEGCLGIWRMIHGDDEEQAKAAQ